MFTFVDEAGCKAPPEFGECVIVGSVEEHNWTSNDKTCEGALNSACYCHSIHVAGVDDADVVALKSVCTWGDAE